MEDRHAPALPFLQSLAVNERDALLGTGRAQGWAAGEIIVRRGDRADSAIVLLTGRVKINTIVGDGVEVILDFCGPGDLLGEISAARDASRSATAIAIEPVEGVVIGVDRMRAFLGAHPRAALALLDLALTRLHVADARLMEFARTDSLARVASRIVEIAERFGDAGADGTIVTSLPITQDELAAWSAASLESTARALRTLRRLRLVETSRRRVTVLDVDRLRTYAQAG